jgi:hypothetical protein
MTLTVTDAKGTTVRKLTSKKEPPEKEEEGDYGGDRYKQTVLPVEPGLHRVVWDLRHEGARPIQGAKVDSGEPRVGPLVNPGTYTLTLTVEGKTYTSKVDVLHDVRTVPVEVLAQWTKALAADRTLTLTDFLRRQPLPFEAGLEEQLRLALKVRDDIDRLSAAVEQLRAVKGQLVTRNELLKDDKKAEPLVKASKDFLKKLDALEERLHNPRAKVAYDILAQKGGAKLYSQLNWLFELLKDSDGAPTQGVREVHADQAQVLDKCVGEWQSLRAGELGKLNDQATKLGLPGVIVPAAKKAP